LNFFCLMPYKAHHCVIDIEDIKGGETAVRLPCLHVFHKTCIDSYFATTPAPRCPTCRLSVPLDSVPGLPTCTARIPPPPRAAAQLERNIAPPPSPPRTPSPLPALVYNTSAAAAVFRPPPPRSRRERLLAALRAIRPTPAAPNPSIFRRRRRRSASSRLRAALAELLIEYSDDSDAELFPRTRNSTCFHFPPTSRLSLLTHSRSGAANCRHRPAPSTPAAAHGK